VVYELAKVGSAPRARYTRHTITIFACGNERAKHKSAAPKEALISQSDGLKCYNMISIGEDTLLYTEITASCAGVAVMLGLLLAIQCRWELGRITGSSGVEIPMLRDYLFLAWFAFVLLMARLVPLLLVLNPSFPQWYTGAIYSNEGEGQDPRSTFAYFGYWLCFEAAASSVAWLFFFYFPSPVAI